MFSLKGNGRFNFGAYDLAASGQVAESAQGGLTLS